MTVVKACIGELLHWHFTTYDIDKVAYGVVPLMLSSIDLLVELICLISMFFMIIGPVPATATWPGNNHSNEPVSTSTPAAQPASKPQWRPVKFNIPQKAS